MSDTDMIILLVFAWVSMVMVVWIGVQYRGYDVPLDIRPFVLRQRAMERMNIRKAFRGEVD
jgi:hypothetical protein